MTASKLETQRKTILHFYNKGTTNAAEIHSLTKIPLRTIHRNLKKIKNTGKIKRKSGSGRPKKITPADVYITYIQVCFTFSYITNIVRNNFRSIFGHRRPQCNYIHFHNVLNC
jgi:transposase